jgi:hypothetical protein
VGEIVPAPPEERPAPTIGVLEVAPAPAPTPPRPAGPPPTRAIEVTKDRAAGSSGANPAREQLWIEFRGHRWTSDGPAVTLDPARFARVGEYHGFPVFARRGEPAEVVFLPAGAGTVAPYRRR